MNENSIVKQDERMKTEEKGEENFMKGGDRKIG